MVYLTVFQISLQIFFSLVFTFITFSFAVTWETTGKLMLVFECMLNTCNKHFTQLKVKIRVCAATTSLFLNFVCFVVEGFF